jgi:hypothetical protein
MTSAIRHEKAHPLPGPSSQTEVVEIARSPPRPTNFPSPLHTNAPNTVQSAEDNDSELNDLITALAEESLPDLNWISLVPPVDPPVATLLEPRSVRLGKLLADLSNIRAAKLRHVNEIADGRPPVLPRARLFQCPSMDKLDIDELLDSWNQAMLRCGHEMSLALVKAEEKAELILRGKIEAEYDVAPVTNLESHTIKIIRDARTRDQHPFVPNTEPLTFFIVKGAGKNQRIVPHETAKKANTSGHKIAGKTEEAKATKAKSKEAKATKDKPEVPAPPRRKNPPKQRRGKVAKTPAATPSVTDSVSRKEKSGQGQKGKAGPKQPATVSAAQPVPPKNTPKVVKQTGGTLTATATIEAPKPAQKTNMAVGTVGHKASAPDISTNGGAKGADGGRPPGTQNQRSYQAPSKNYNQQWRQNQPRYQGGNYGSNWRSQLPPMPPPSYYNHPPPHWEQQNWSTGWQNHRTDQYGPQHYVGNDAPPWPKQKRRNF